MGEFTAYPDHNRQNAVFRLRVAVAVLAISFGLISLFFGLVLYRREFSPVDGADLKMLVSEKREDTDVRDIFVDVAGAVVKPGVYQSPFGAKVLEALSLAGGVSLEADKLWVARNLNLAQVLTNGQKIYIPFLNEQSLIGGDSNPGSHSQQSANALIDINTASQTELESLPDIGPTRAATIIANRPYASTAALLETKILGEKTFAKIKDLITVGGG